MYGLIFIQEHAALGVLFSGLAWILTESEPMQITRQGAFIGAVTPSYKNATIVLLFLFFSALLLLAFWLLLK